MNSPRNSTPDWNVKKFEQKLEKEVKHRKDFTSPVKLSPREKPASGLFDQFFLIGIPPCQDIESQPEILVAFPPFELPGLPIDRIIAHALPTGPTRHYLKKFKSSPIQDEFVFQFGSGEDPYYGICVHISTANTGKPFYGSKKTKKSTFCFCLLTRVPAFSSHFSFLTYIGLLTVGHIKRIHDFSGESISVKMPPGSPINELDLDRQIGYHPQIKVPDAFTNELAFYYILTLDSPPETYSSDKNCELILRFPEHNDVFQKAIGWASLDTLFSLLPVIDILTILTGLLLDRQVLVVGSCLQEVSMAIYGLQTLLLPFKFAGTIIPVLPIEGDFLEILQLPTPWLIGVAPCPKLKKMTFIDTAIFIDLDKRSLPTVRDIPKFPMAVKTTSELTKLLSKQKHSELGHPFGFPSIYSKNLDHKYTFTQQMFDKITKIIQLPFNQVFTRDVYGFFVTDIQAAPEGVTIFNEELFLAQVSADKSFWENVVESQTFQIYIEDKLLEYIDEKAANDNNGRRPSIGSAPHRMRRAHSRTKVVHFISDLSDES
ncbi:hypothetical protein TRFO_21416 [Tritrichomonas foetus]|uniref:UDENN domain-containing protein n=1 Tax=Tritrichomonas foetus TaxID=1144522 RepID=A0A1J4KDV9_9EUKA|nr:hypothetical protein TRFO_21416 [Tritrichomonas foetus]|eukprot:OHT09617.1 hypothetical protein TRFO_21416 [Tritrichomonas foetus]